MLNPSVTLSPIFQPASKLCQSCLHDKVGASIASWLRLLFGYAALSARAALFCTVHEVDDRRYCDHDRSECAGTIGHSEQMNSLKMMVLVLVLLLFTCVWGLPT
jgi:hypothetical protein